MIKGAIRSTEHPWSYRENFWFLPIEYDVIDTYTFFFCSCSNQVKKALHLLIRWEFSL